MNPMIIPVIHFQSDDQVRRNVDISVAAGCKAIMLIDMTGQNLEMIESAIKTKEQHPDLLVGANHLAERASDALTYNISDGLDMTWTDEQLTHSQRELSYENVSLALKLEAHPEHLFFCGVAFKHQNHEPDPVKAALRAEDSGFIATTSGPATGMPAEEQAIANLRKGMGPEAKLAIASGITPTNFLKFKPYLTHVLVATGISRSFYEIDEDKLSRLMSL